MAEVKNRKCTTVEPTTDPKNPSPKCPGTVLRFESPISKPVIIKGVTYTDYEVCQRCGQVFPG